MTTWKIEQNDVIEWAREYQGEKFHALLTDAPYHLTSITKRFGKAGSAPAKGDVYRRASAGFMSQTWDGGGISFDPATWEALAEHLYPGAFGMTFASPRTHHRIACAIEDAGMIIQPTFYCWVYLSGFPKATQISSQIDRAAGVKGETVGTKRAGFGKRNGLKDSDGGIFLNSLPEELKQVPVTAPATELAQAWQGHRYGGQAIKPAVEPVIIFQKPYGGRPVDSIVATGAGALNIDGGRIGADTSRGDRYNGKSPKGGTGYGGYEQMEKWEATPGRWPSNFLLQHHPEDNGECHPDCPVRLFDEQAGETGHTGAAYDPNTNHTHFAGKWEASHTGEHYGDSGPASRMFYQAGWAYEVAEQLANAEPVRYEPKVSSSEREAGLEDLETRTRHRVNAGGLENEPRFAPTQVKNNHPTLKPISLTKYLATLLLPPAAYAPRRILVPFAGVGSEMSGAILAGWEEVIGIEREANYVKIAEARLRWWSQWPGWGQTDVDAILAAAKDKEDDRQLTMFGVA